MPTPRTTDLPGYPFRRLNELLRDIPAPAGSEPLSLAMGEPQHATPPMVAPIIQEHAHQWNKYPPVEGTPALREAVTDWLTRRYALRPETVERHVDLLPVAGTREALFLLAHLCRAAKSQGSRPAIVIPNPFYHVYAGAAASAGAECVPLPCTPDNGFLPDVAAVDRELLWRTSLVYVCTPSNPQGAVASLDYLKSLIVLAHEYQFVLAVDECYSEIYDGEPPPGALQAAQELGGGFENLLVFHSLSKRSSVPGLRSGFVAGSPELMSGFAELRRFAGATIPCPLMAASAALWRDEEHVAHNRLLYRRKIDIAEEILGGRFGFYRPAGGFFLWLDVGDGEAAARRLWAEAGVRVLPGAYLAHELPDGSNPGAPYIRVALVHDEETTRAGLARLVSVLT